MHNDKWAIVLFAVSIGKEPEVIIGKNVRPERDNGPTKPDPVPATATATAAAATATTEPGAGAGTEGSEVGRFAKGSERIRPVLLCERQHAAQNRPEHDSKSHRFHGQHVPTHRRQVLHHAAV